MIEKIKNHFTLFTKPWPDKSLPELAKFVKDLGFDGVELPVRPDYQVTSETVTKGLPEAARILGDHGVKIGSVAGSLSGKTDETLIAARGEAGVPILRMLERIDMSKGYHRWVDEIHREYDRLMPALEKHNVALGVQNHYGYFVASAIGSCHFVQKYDPKRVGIVLDTAHCGLDGEPDDMAIDIAFPRLLMVNLKNGYWRRTTGTEAEDVQWEVYWTNARQGLTSWPVVARELKKRGYQGDYCLHAEYTAEEDVDRLIAEDIVYARSLFA